MKIQNQNSYSDDSIAENEANGNIIESPKTKLVIRCARQQKASYINAAGGAKLETWVLGVLDREVSEQDMIKRFVSQPYSKCGACGGNVSAMNNAKPTKNGNVVVICELCGSRSLTRFNPDNHFGA